MKKSIRFAVFIALIPLMVLTAIWLVTLGAFNYIDAVHSDQMIVFSAFFTILALVAIIAGLQDT